jgi:hypothetical protein
LSNLANFSFSSGNQPASMVGFIGSVSVLFAESFFYLIKMQLAMDRTIQPELFAKALYLGTRLKS